MAVYIDKTIIYLFSMVKTSNFQKPFLPFDFSDSGEGSWPGTQIFRNFEKNFNDPFS